MPLHYVRGLLDILQQGLVRIHNPERLTFYEDFQQNILKFCVGVLLIYLLNEDTLSSSHSKRD